MPATDARRRLAEEQARLLHALTGEGRPPPGFDVGRLHATAEALARKRARAAARAWPLLAAALGVRFDTLFAAFAAQTALPREGGSLADGRAFAAHLKALGQLPDEGMLEALAVDLRYRRTARGLRPRRGPTLWGAWLPRARRWAVAVRLPWLGVKWLLG